jgi:cell division protein FtsW
MGIVAKQRQFDVRLFFPVLFLSLLSVALIYSAKHASFDDSEKLLFVKQALWVLLGLVLFFVAYRIPIRMHEVLAYFYYAVGLLLLVGLFILSTWGPSTFNPVK